MLKNGKSNMFVIIICNLQNNDNLIIAWNDFLLYKAQIKQLG